MGRDAWNPGAHTQAGRQMLAWSSVMYLRPCVRITAPGQEGQKYNLFQEGLGAQDWKATVQSAPGGPR